MDWGRRIALILTVAVVAPYVRPAAADQILRYTDGRGTVHITNVTRAKPTPPTFQEAPQGLPDNPPPSLRKVSWNPEDRSPLGPINRGTALQTPLPEVVRGYRDSRGIIRITNVSPESREITPRLAIATREPPTAPGALGRNGARSRKKGEDSGKPPLKPAARSGDLALCRAPPTAAPHSQPLAFTGSTIRRYRDGKGVCHIESLDPPGPEIRPSLAAPAYANASLRGSVSLQPHEEMAEGRPPPSGPLGSQVVAFKDRLGRMHICNPASPGQAGKAPPLAVAALETIILEAALNHRLPVPLVQALIKVESNFVTGAVSPKGAMGLMQLMPDTASFLGVTNPFCPRQNIQAGCRYFRLLLDIFGDCLPLALAAYNAGFQRVIGAGYRVPAITETQVFVTQVLERYYSAIAGGRRASASGGASGPGRSPFT